MEYIAALTPPVVMAVAFALVIRTIIKSQGGANRAKEDAAVDSMLASGGANTANAAERAEERQG